ncbi:hypothetical protein MAMMFC1_01601 [Methylomusa anaerophila]|uniref:Uncharacterized protein n=1 Tax=Methylomusa anaerophila TaxID=1930071 RepID=A0A348AIN6_9FIRM|nr:hypothetical protein MAMMFC1_01601 [Methylomusa anaerophila]
MKCHGDNSGDMKYKHWIMSRELSHRQQVADILLDSENNGVYHQTGLKIPKQVPRPCVFQDS